MMSFLSAADFMKIPAVRAAVAAPRSVSSVLTYFTTIDISKKNDAARASLSRDEVVGPLLGVWFMAGEALDAFAKPFAPVIRELKAGTLTDSEWATVEGRIAQVLLADQLSRSCFRGKPEAFEYDAIARGLLNELIEKHLEELLEQPCALLYLLPWALAHSENIKDLTTATTFLAKAIKKHPHFTLFKGRNRLMIEQHRAVLAKFGRYPHRNKQHGRKFTAEERAWFDDKEALPGWVPGGKWACASPEWLKRLGALLAEGKPLPVAMPRP